MGAGLILALPVILPPPVVFATAPAAVTVVATVSVGDDPSAIAIDPTTHRVYVTNRQSDSVSIIDGGTNQVIATVAVGAQPDAVAVDPALQRIYVANGRGATLSVLDGRSSIIVASIPVGGWPDAVVVDPSTHRLFESDGGANPGVTDLSGDTIRLLDGRTGLQLAVKSVNGWVFGLALDPLTHHVYDTNNYKYPADGEVDRINGALAYDGSYPLRYTAEGVAVDPLTQRVFVGRLLTDLVVLDPAPGTPYGYRERVVTVGVGLHFLAVDLSTHTVYVANGSSHTVSVVDEQTLQVVATVPIGPPSTAYFTTENTGPGPIAVDPTTHVVYVADRSGHTVTVLHGIGYGTPAPPSPPALPETGGGGCASGQCDVQAR